MAFQQIDDSAVADGRHVDSALLTDIEGNVQAALDERGRFGSWGASYDDPPRLCSGTTRGLIPYLWYRDAGVTELTVTIHHSPAAETVDGFELGVSITPLRSGQPPYAPGSPMQTTTIGSATSGATTTVLTLDEDDLAGVEPGWSMVFLSILSDEGTPENIDDGLGAKETDQLLSWERSYIAVAATAAQYTAEAVPCELIEVYDFSASDSLYPRRYQVLRVEDTTTLYRLHVFPFLPETSAEASQYSSTTDYLRRIPLGYTDLYSVSIEATDRTALDSGGAAHDGGALTRAPTVGALYRKGERLFRENTTTHHIGPQDDDTTDSNLTGTPLFNPLSNAIEVTGGWSLLGRCMVGVDDTYERPYGSSAYSRVHYDAVALVLLQHYEPHGEDFRPWSMDFRLSLIDDDNTSNIRNGQTVNLGTDAEAFPSYGSRGYLASAADAWPWVMTAYLAGFSTIYNAGGSYLDEYGTLRKHSLRGVWPDAVWNLGHFTPIRLQVLDNATDDRRLLRVQVQPKDGTDADLRGQSYTYPNFVHCASLGVITTSVQRADQGALGVT